MIIPFIIYSTFHVVYFDEVILEVQFITLLFIKILDPEELSTISDDSSGGSEFVLFMSYLSIYYV